MRTAESLPRAAGRHTLLIVIVAVMLLPMAWAFGASFKPVNTIFDLSPLPFPATISNYQAAIDQFPIGRLLLNTLVMSAGVTAVDLLVAVPAAYALARFAVRGRVVVTAVVGLALLVPPQALVIPQFLAISHLGWQNTYQGLILPQVSTAALAVVLLRQYVASLPPTLFGAAVLDGATRWEVLRYVVLPMLRPALGAVSILLFINAWNEYLWPILAAPSPSITTVQPGLAQFISPENPEYGPLLAASVLASLPVIVAYLFASRRITDAFLHAGVR